jgi:hypothetical protein
MRVLHVIPSLSVKEGGPSFAIKAMAEALAGQGVQVTVATTTGSREQGVRSERSRAWSMADLFSEGVRALQGLFWSGEVVAGERGEVRSCSHSRTVLV